MNWDWLNNFEFVGKIYGTSSEYIWAVFEQIWIDFELIWKKSSSESDCLAQKWSETNPGQAPSMFHEYLSTIQYFQFKTIHTNGLDSQRTKICGIWDTSGV